MASLHIGRARMLFITGVVLFSCSQVKPSISATVSSDAATTSMQADTTVPTSVSPTASSSIITTTTIPKCPDLHITNAAITYSTNENGGTHPYNTIATITCSVGYETADGQSQTQTSCIDEETWNVTDIQCSLKKCPDLNITNAAITYSTNENGGTHPYNTIATITCSVGYETADGQSQTQTSCTENKTWNRTDIQCNLKKCPDLNITNAAITYSTNENGGTHPYNTIATITCSVGYETADGQSQTQTSCTENKTWNRTDIQCNLKKCPDLNITNAAITYSTNENGGTHPYNTIATITCSVGYETADGQSHTQTSCTENKTWNRTDIQCKMKKCPDLNITNAAITYSTNENGGTHPYNTIATITCSVGYETADGQSQTQTSCIDEETWNVTDIQCSLKKCQDFNVQNAAITYSASGNGGTHPYNTIATITCSAGYETAAGQSQTQTSCTENKTWNLTDIQCSLKVVSYNGSCDLDGQCSSTTNAHCIKGRCTCNMTTSVYINTTCQERSPPTLEVSTYKTATLIFSITKGNEPSSHYKVCRINGACKTVMVETNMVVDFGNLSAGICYNFNITSNDDEYAAVGTVLACTRPDQPKHLRIKSHSKNQLEISWTYTGKYTYFEARLIPRSSSESFKLANESIDTAENNSFKHTFPGLKSATEYIIELTTNLNNLNSNVSSITTCTNPDRPTKCNKTDTTDQSVTLTWEASTTQKSYFIINGTKTNLTKVGEKFYFTPNSSLCPGSKYTYAIQAGIDCNDERLSESCSVCGTTLPSKPSNLQIQDRQSTSVNATWNKGPGEIDSYRPILNMNDSSVSTAMPSFLYKSTISITGLKAATLYRLNVFSLKNDTCKDGLQLTSENPVAATFYTRPNTPTVVIQTTGVNASGFTVEWNNDTSFCTSYRVIVALKGNEVDQHDTLTGCCGAFQVQFYSLKPGQLYTIKLFTAINKTLLSKESVEDSIYTETPGVKSQSIHVTNTTINETTVAWNAPSANTSYQYKVNFTCTSPNGNRSTIIYPGSVHGTTATVRGLDPGSNCSVEIRVNIGDQISHTTEKVLDRLTDEAEPESVSSLTSFNKTSTSIEISWQTPINRNGIIRRYDLLIGTYTPDSCEPGDANKNSSIQCERRITFMCKDCTTEIIERPVKKVCPNNTTINFEDNEETFSYIITDLHSFMQYSITVVPYTFKHGREKVTNVTTDQDVPTSVPQNTHVTSVSESNITVMWNPPKCGGRNGDITHYIIKYTFFDHICVDELMDRSLTKQNNVSVTAARVSMSRTLTNLYSYWDYDISISAWTSAGEGPFSDPVKKKTSTTTPGIVRYVQFDDASKTSDELHVSWKQPCNPNGVITSYTLQLVNTDIGGLNQTISTNETSKLLTGLLPYRNYTLVISAGTRTGNGNMSNSVSDRTAIGVPYPPLVVVADVHNYSSIEVSWKTNNFTGPTYYTALSTSNHGLNCSVNGFRSTSCVIGGLAPYTNYSFIVIAYTDAGNKTSVESESKQTNETVPGSVTELVVTTENNVSKARSIFIKWRLPKRGDRHGAIIGYQIDVQHRQQQSNIFCAIPTTDSAASCMPNSVYISCTGDRLDPENDIHCTLTQTITTGNYSVTVKAKTYVGTGDGSVDHAVVQPGAPLKVNEENGILLVQESRSSVSDPKRQVPVQFPYKLMCDDTNGKPVEWGVIVSEESLANGITFNGQRSRFQSFQNSQYKTWFQVEDSDNMSPYIATPAAWNPCSTPPGTRKRRATPRMNINFVVGESNDCSGIPQTQRCNGELVPGKSYRVKIYVCTDGGCTETKYSNPLSTEALVNIGLIAGVVCAVIVLAVVCVALFILRRRKKLCFAKALDEEVLSHRSEPPTVGAEMHDITHSVSRFRKGPVKLIDFPDHVFKLYKDSKLIFTEAYNLLKEECPTHPMTAAEAQSSRPKNRYTNILPYDHSRVKLLPLDDDEDSDYINANYIPGYTSKREYIATQGPMIATFNDFWRMVWEQNVDTIVMLTKLVEKGRHKCDKYWPDLNEPVFYGDLVVCVQSESHLSDYTIRVIEVKLKAARRMVRQFCYLKWPDMGCPDQPTQLLDFVKSVKEYTKANSSNKGPMIVHCSAGVGRTGTFIAVDYLLQYIRDHDEMDIYKLVLDMRNYRCNMVQTEDQFVYIHDCMKEFITVDDEEEDDDDEEPTYINVKNENVYENTGFTAEM